MSDDLPIQKALAAAMADVGPVDKSDWNDFHKYRFRGIDRVLDAVAPALRKHGIVIVPKVRRLVSRDVTTEKGKTAREVTVTVDYRVTGPAGDWVKPRILGESQDTSDKAIAKAMSVAYRTLLIELFAIATGEADPDAERGHTRKSELDKAVEQVQMLATGRGWSFDDLQRDYASRFEGGDIKTATAAALKSYIELLDPKPETVKVQRQRRRQQP